MKRLGNNAARVFIEPVVTIQGFLSNNHNTWGLDLQGNNVTSQTAFDTAIATLRTPNGRSATYAWSNPFPYTALFTSIATGTTAIYGNSEYIINSLKGIGVTNILLAEHIGSSGSNVHFVFSTLDPTTTTYWTEAWELYQFSYAEALYAWNKVSSGCFFFIIIFILWFNLKNNNS